MKLKQRIMDLGIREKFALCVLFCILIPFCATFFYMKVWVAGNVERQNRQITLEVLKQTSPALRNVVRDLEDVSLTLSMDSAMQRYLHQVLQEGNGYSQAKAVAGGMLDDILEVRSYLTQIAIYDRDGILLQSGSYQLANPYQEELASVEKQLGKPVWYPARDDGHYFLVADRIREITMIRGINNISLYRQIMAYVKISFPEEYLASLYDSVVTPETKNILIVQADGQVVSSLDKAYLGGNIRQEPYFQSLETDAQWQMYGDTLICQYTMDAVPWRVIQILDARQSSVSVLINWIFFIAIGLIALFVLVFFWLQQASLLNPIRKLSTDVEAFRDETTAIGLYAYTQDEIGRLNQGISAMAQRIHTLIEDGYKSQLREKQAQLRALQMQINPHFLYNTLESIRWMAYREKATDVAAQVEALSRLFRHALNSGSEETTLADEIQHVEDYVTLQRNKFGERLIYTAQVEPALLPQHVQNLVLQPLVENCMTHGFAHKLGECRIDVRIERVGEEIQYQIHDNGLGTDEADIRRQLEAGAPSENSFALTNIQQRIRYRYGAAYGIQFHSAPQMGTTVFIHFPIHPVAQEEKP